MQRTGHVLVVDDQNDIVDLIVDFLRDEGYDVRGLTDGTAALTAIADQPPALILLDMFMPQMTGTELWEYLQSNHLADIPVVLMTASPSAAEHLLAQGATDYLAKPFDLDNLLACVERYVRTEETPPPQPSVLPLSA
jgi:two-component system response regulator MprA